MQNQKIVDVTDKDLPKEDRIITLALKRFRIGEDAEKVNRDHAYNDLRMLIGKDHWPADIMKQRELDNRPVLVINKLPIFTDRIMNEARINKVGIKVIPYGQGATPEVAEIYNGLIKAIENHSNADVARETALEGAVQCGFGYYRISTSYVDETSYEQEIVIKRIKNNFSVVIDPTFVEHDASDAKWMFVTELISRDEYKQRWPNLEPPASLDSSNNATGDDTWFDNDLVRVAEYWVKEPKKKKVHLLSDNRTVDDEEWQKALPGLQAQEKIMHMAPDAQGNPIIMEGPAPEGSGFPEEILNPVPEILRTRVVDSHEVHQYLMDGVKIIEGPTTWPGYYIPVIPIWGKEITIDNVTYLRGCIRNAKESQKIFNYMRTASVETTALIPKAPYIGTPAQFDGHEDMWDTANQTNVARLLYNPDPEAPAKPSRDVVTQTAISELTESNIAGEEMKDTTGIQDASLGIAGNEVSGRALARRQSQSDLNNYTYHDNARRAIKYEGRQLIDLIPKVYDTERQVAIIMPDDTERFVTVNQEVINPTTGEKTILNNLTQGRYNVTATTGPNFATQQEEATEAMMGFIQMAPDAALAVLDLIAENQNWPGAERISKRIKRLFLPPNIDSDEPPPPPEPTIDDKIKNSKLNSIDLGNQKKGLDIVDKRREMTSNNGQIKEAQAGLNIMSQLQKLRGND